MKAKTNNLLIQRPRRLRSDATIRRLVAETKLSVDDLIWPIFIHEAKSDQAIASMPAVKRLSATSLERACERALKLSIPAIALFPCVANKLRTTTGKEAFNDKGLIQTSVRTIKRKFPELLVMVDVALDPYTNHGHDGILAANGKILNDPTVAALTKQAGSLAAAGADIIAPSDMMDGRVEAIRTQLEIDGHTDSKIMSYAVKYASAFYGPFRDATGSGNLLKGDKRSYQMDPRNSLEALREAQLDLDQGADMLLVKPGMAYLDILQLLASNLTAPLFAYQVSGEYAMIKAAAANGWLDEQAVILESLIAFKRAGASGVLSYFAPTVAEILNN